MAQTESKEKNHIKENLSIDIPYCLKMWHVQLRKGKMLFFCRTGNYVESEELIGSFILPQF